MLLFVNDSWWNHVEICIRLIKEFTLRMFTLTTELLFHVKIQKIMYNVLMKGLSNITKCKFDRQGKGVQERF